MSYLKLHSFAHNKPSSTHPPIHSLSFAVCNKVVDNFIQILRPLHLFIWNKIEINRIWKFENDEKYLKSSHYTLQTWTRVTCTKLQRWRHTKLTSPRDTSSQITAHRNQKIEVWRQNKEHDVCSKLAKNLDGHSSATIQ